MIDRTEQERLLIIYNLSLRQSIIIQKAPMQSSTKRLCASRAQNDVLEAARRLRSPPSPHRKVQREEILMRSVLILYVSLLSPFF